MIAVDTNIFVYAHRADSQWHEPAHDCIKNLAEGRVSWGIPWTRVHELLSIVTHPKIYDLPSSLDKALDQVDAWLESPVAYLIAETESHWGPEGIVIGHFPAGEIGSWLVMPTRATYTTSTLSTR